MAKAIKEGRCAPAHVPSADEALYGGCGMGSAAVVIGSFLSATTDANRAGRQSSCRRFHKELKNIDSDAIQLTKGIGGILSG